MSNRNFDASIITKRLGNKAVAKSIISIYNHNTQPQTSNLSASVINQVDEGNSMVVYRGPTCTTVDNGCPCNTQSTNRITSFTSSAAPPWLNLLIKASSIPGSSINSSSIEVGNVISIVGYYTGTIDIYNASNGDVVSSKIMSLSSVGSFDAFIALYNLDGILLWSSKISSVSQDISIQSVLTNDGVYLSVISVTAGTNVYNGGLSDPSTPVVVLTGTGASQGILVKYTYSGVVEWVTKFLGWGEIWAFSLITDGSNIYWSSQFSTGVNPNLVFDGILGNPTTPVFQLTCPIGRFHSIIKYSSTGQVQWAAKLGNNASGGTPFFVGPYLSISNSQILMSGTFINSVDIYGGVYADPSVISMSMTSTASAQNIYLASFNINTGALNWATKTSGTGDNRNGSITCDSSGNIYVYAQFINNINLFNANGLIDPVAVATTLTPISSTNAALIKYSSTGQLLWTTKISGTLTIYQGPYMEVLNSDIFIIASGTGTLNFYNSNTSISNPATIGQTYVISGSQNILVVKYNIDTGNFILVNRINSSASLRGDSISISNNIVYVSGSVDGTTNLYNMNGTIPNTLPSVIINLTGTTSLTTRYNTNGNLLTN